MGEIYEEDILFERALTRKEKELLYNDKGELKLAKIDSKYLSYLKVIPEVDDYSKLRNRIVKEFLDIRLLSEIEINDVEYNLLRVYFKKISTNQSQYRKTSCRYYVFYQ